MTTRNTVAAALLALGVALALAGCGTHTSAPDPDPTGNTPGSHAHVIQEPYGFRNVSFSCNGVDGVYVTSAGGSDNLPSGVAVVPNDPQCKP